MVIVLFTSAGDIKDSRISGERNFHDWTDFKSFNLWLASSLKPLGQSRANIFKGYARLDPLDLLFLHILWRIEDYLALAQLIFFGFNHTFPVRAHWCRARWG